MKRLIKATSLALVFAGLIGCGQKNTCESYGEQNYEKYKTMKVKKVKSNAFSYKKERYNLEFQRNGS